MNESVLNGLRLLVVFFEDEQGLVSLTTGDLLMHTSYNHATGTPANIPAISLEANNATGLLIDRYGDEVNWSNAIEFLREHYNWETKRLDV